jgi:hypothetical protein
MITTTLAVTSAPITVSLGRPFSSARSGRAVVGRGADPRGATLYRFSGSVGLEASGAERWALDHMRATQCGACQEYARAGPIAESLRSVTVTAIGEGLGVDRRVDRHLRNSLCRVCVRGIREALVQVKQTLRTSVLLLIRWFRVRPPGAPQALACGYASLRVIMSPAREARVRPR